MSEAAPSAQLTTWPIFRLDVQEITLGVLDLTHARSDGALAGGERFPALSRALYARGRPTGFTQEREVLNLGGDGRAQGLSIA